MNYSQILLRDGVVVIPSFTSMDLKTYNTALWQTIRSFPEYISPQNNSTMFIQDSFGALGNPSSFHNPVVRHIRINMMFRGVEIFKPIIGERKLEQLIDRLSIRRKGTSLPKESWHRDQSNCLPDDLILGGWVNFDTSHEQRFSCIPGSHIMKNEDYGFIRQENVDESRKVIYSIPPGSWILFFQNIIHEVLPGKTYFDSLRLYIGWRLTHHHTPLYDQSSAIQDQGVPYNPCGILPTMYTGNHLRFHQEKTSNWSIETFRPECLEKKRVKNGDIQIVDRVMKSLKYYNLPLYPKYTSEELSILSPARQWIIDSKELNL